jgi:hypothetical protein
MCGRLWEDLSDLQALVDGISSGNPDWAAYLFDNVNIAAVINYMTSSVIMHENDHTHKNFFLYRDTEGTGEWMFLPWDKDLTFGITNGIEYEFPAGVSIPAHGYLIIAHDPAAFNALYGAGLPAGVQVLGPFANDTKLNNSGERVTLSRPGDKEWLSERYYICIDSTEYNNTDPWPAAADGGGASLQHRHPDSGDARELYTNDSANWAAAEPGPGR